jgi:predicted PurR-regulated permease PerM
MDQTVPVPPPGSRPSGASPTPGWLSRERALALALLAATAVTFYLCYRIVQPFLPALAWALALAVVASPFHRALARRIRRPGLAAGLAVATVTFLIIGPVALVSQRLVGDASRAVATVENAAEGWWSALQQTPVVGPVLRWVDVQLDLSDLTEQAGTAATSASGAILSGSIWVVMQLFITVFLLFYFFRDRRAAERLIRELLPLSDAEAGTVFGRVTDTIRATVFGSLAVAAVQGFMGGLMFWLLGLPAALFWGVVMALLATIPVLGTFLVWAPAALFLALGGAWGKALILTAWGATAIGLIDNLLYPLLVGTQLRMHPVPVFFSLVGGLALYGAAGLILGPLTLAVAVSLIDIWRWRTAHGRSAEAPLGSPAGDAQSGVDSAGTQAIGAVRATT